MTFTEAVYLRSKQIDEAERQFKIKRLKYVAWYKAPVKDSITTPIPTLPTHE